MTELVRRLQQALGDAYRVERELGGGGMSRVFVAEETALGRKVVLKVLPPDLGAGLNVDRFRREIQLAASLQHPHIVPLHAAGQADGLLYFTMPLVEGEALRAKLAREGEQPVGEAVRILRDIVDALVYAHGRGVVHRDIKPDNVLISHHHALVTDFGVAKALSESTGRSTFTSAGVALGTPAYMAPEQASADPHTDHRADIYAVGAVAYEMLTGRPPFTAPTAQAVLAAHVTKPVEPIGELRPSLPPALQALVMRCLEKKPADRWQSAEELLHQLEVMATPSGGMAPTARVPAIRRRGRSAAAAAMLLALTLVGVVFWSRRAASRSAPALADNVIAVFPFRVSGADQQLAYLGDGMVDLLATQLTGEGGPRALDPRVSLSAWGRVGGASTEADAAPGAARELGARTLLEGSIVGTPGRLVLAAALRDAITGATRGQAKVEGPVDSLPVLVDRLTGQLLLENAGRDERSLAALTTLPALRAYLEGQAAYRRGSYEEAVRHFDRALRVDSTFALAALYRESAAGWCCRTGGKALRWAWAGRDRLSPADRALLLAEAGPRYPGESSDGELLRAWETAVSIAPDRAEAWYRLGDVLFHDGRLLGIESSWERSREAFRRSIALDPTFAGPLQHLVELAAREEDTAAVRALVEVALRADSTSEVAPYLRWRLAVATEDSASLRELRAEFGRMPRQSLFNISAMAQQDGVATEDVMPLLEVLAARATTTEERAGNLIDRWAASMNAGRPLEAQAALQSLSGLDGQRERSEVAAIFSAIYWNGDSALAAHAAQSLASRTQGADSVAPVPPAVARCAVAQWDLAMGRSAAAERTAALLRSGGTAETAEGRLLVAETCAFLLEAWAASHAGRADAAQRIAALDSVLLTGPGLWSGYANLLLSRLLEDRVDIPRALAVLKRRTYWRGHPLFLSAYLREEGRLAALSGDREGAVQAYQQYLALRRDPEAAVVPQVNQVKAELAKLLAER